MVFNCDSSDNSDWNKNNESLATSTWKQSILFAASSWTGIIWSQIKFCTTP